MHPAPPAPGARARTGGAPDRVVARRPRRDHSGVLRWTARLAAVVPALALAGLTVALLVEALPAIKVNGLGFFTGSAWNPGNFYNPPVTTGGVSHPAGSDYGALPLIVGTLLSSAIAMAIAVPIAFGTALVVVHKLPRRLSSSVGMLLEILAGIPSVVFGLWAALTMGPWLAHHVSPVIASNVPDVPVLRYFKGPVGSGEGLLTSSLVLAVMIVPIVAATSRDLLRQVPRTTLEGATALGLTDAEMVRTVSIPWVRTGVIGASVLGLGRALGETMAVAMASGTIIGVIPHNIYGTFASMAGVIVSQLDSALTDATGFAVKTLAELGLVLMVISLAANVGARLLVRRTSGTALPVGRGI